MLYKTIRRFPPEEVTTIADEVPPEAANLTPKDIDAIWKSVVRFYKTGLHPAIALCIRRHGKIVLDRTIGHAWGNGPDDPQRQPKQLATPDTLFNMFSASKSITAMLIHLLDEQALIHLDDPVEEYIPEFTQGSKRHVTIRHVLTHRAGIPNVNAGPNPLDLLTDEAAIVDRICKTKSRSRPGRHLAYHAVSGGFILAEIAKRVTGKGIQQLLNESIRKPLGFENLAYGVPANRAHDVAQHAFTGPPPLQPYGWLLERSLGMDIRRAVVLSNDLRFLTGVIPSGNIVATPREVSRFFELLLRQGTLDGVQVFHPRTVRRAVAETSYLELDTTLMLPVRYGMGFMLGGQYLSFFGPDTPHAFGHLGFTNILSYADPQRDISVALMNTGKPFVSAKLLYWLNIMRVIASRIPKISQIQ